MGVLTSQKHKPNLLRMQVRASFCLDCGVLPQLTLVDPGAEDNLLDQKLAVLAGLQLEELKEPILAYALDGRLPAKVTHISTIP